MLSRCICIQIALGVPGYASAVIGTKATGDLSLIFRVCLASVFLSRGATWASIAVYHVVLDVSALSPTQCIFFFWAAKAVENRHTLYTKDCNVQLSFINFA